MPSALDVLAQEVVACQRCPRLVAYREAIARHKRRAYRDEEYWGRPVPGFGDPQARLVVIGLAPAAHGGNRTGRMFTGDSSGDWLYRALYRAGFASQPVSRSRDDGLELRDAYVTAACRCAPPDNRPTRQELAACQPYLVRELQLLERARVLVCLGQIAFAAALAALRNLGAGAPVPVDETATRPPRFRHGAVYRWETVPAREHGFWLVASYHPSRRNTQTGLLSEAMFDAVFARARELLGDDGRQSS
ncbi:uracil-DNA glycosylase [Thermomicrobium sp. 4228-Ro]|uniref:uracil-DNA glycosylase n=1 Tax=Thermomicrobium sp. 4228-Ro TaxID=2993937 RepID=UPI0022496849|nr:uracil-DNA glycosylase [Thermomicrobium sp. 4228-Ro]MCX2728200.1 uracil-DNA glycosylase [Thermomicrobium sp. 4228-Ro]